MRVLIISPTDLNSIYGGGQVYLKNILNELILKKYSLEIACPGEQKEVYYENIKIHYFDINEGEQGIKDLLVKVKPAIIHAHGFKALFSRIGYEFGISVVITAHHGGILCPAGAFLNHRDEICKVKAEFKNCLPCVLKNIRLGSNAYPFVNKIPKTTYEGIGNWLSKKPFVPYISPVLGVAKSIKQKEDDWDTIVKYSSLMIAPSLAIASAMERNGYPKEKIKVIPHGIPLPSNPARKSNSNLKPQFFYLGRINRVKGIHVLWEAIQGIEMDFDLHIFGNAVTKEEKRYLAELKRKSEPDRRVHWSGGIPSDKVFETIQSMDLMIHPTICVEIFGLNIAETLALGIPVLATRCGGAEMQIRDGENGYLVTPNDVEELKKAMQKFTDAPNALKVDPSKVVSIEEHVEKLLEVYASFID